MIPPPPPPLTRKASLNTHQPFHSIGRHGVQQQQLNSSANVNNSNNKGNNKLNKRVENSGTQINYSQKQQKLLNNKPDLFNFSSTPATTIDNKNKMLNDDNSGRCRDSGADELPINMKPYPPFYFDDNHFQHHCITNTGQSITGPNNKENELFFYHHEPANYIPNNYDHFSAFGGPHAGKYNTIGSHHSINSKYHGSACNVNHFHDNNLLSGHHFSTSLSNFSQTNPHAYHQFHSGTLGLGFGNSSLVGGSFNSNGSLGEKRQTGVSWKHHNCPSRNSSSSGTNSGSK